jgi:hypothetical protein
MEAQTADTTSAKPKPLSSDEVGKMYDRLRQKIQHEDTLLGQRLSWLLTSQGFFFVAFGLVTNAPHTTYKTAVISTISLLGIAISLLTLQGIINASVAIGEAFNWWITATAHPDTDTSLTPPVIGKSRWYSDSRATSWGTPIVTLVVWLTILVWSIA